VTDPAGAEVGQVSYDPWGQVISTTLPLTLTDRLFTGQVFDASTGLYYYNARYYDLSVGQFTQPDSLVADPLNPAAWNRFSYVYNAPTNYVDPSGHLGLPIDWLLDIGGLVLDLQQLQQDPSLANWALLGLDVALWAVPYVPNVGLLRQAGRLGDAKRILVVGENSSQGG
jgi:RHS repeat-associated protein